MLKDEIHKLENDSSILKCKIKHSFWCKCYTTFHIYQRNSRFITVGLTSIISSNIIWCYIKFFKVKEWNYHLRFFSYILFLFFFCIQPKCPIALEMHLCRTTCCYCWKENNSCGHIGCCFEDKKYFPKGVACCIYFQ